MKEFCCEVEDDEEELAFALFSRMHSLTIAVLPVPGRPDTYMAAPSPSPDSMELFRKAEIAARSLSRPGSRGGTYEICSIELAKRICSSLDEVE